MSDQPKFQHGDWFKQNIALLTKVLAPLKDKPGVQGLEIGCFEGRGSRWFVENILSGPGGHLICIDNFKGSQEHQNIDMQEVKANWQHNLAPWLPRTLMADWRVSLREMDSIEALANMIGSLKFDFIFVDGSHKAPDVLSDLVLSWPLLKTGGALVADDYLWPGIDYNRLNRPAAGIDAFLNVFAEKLEILHKEYSVAVKKLSA